MKIALVSPYDYPFPGGVTEHIAALDKHFRALGHDTRIIAPSTTNGHGLSNHVICVSDEVSNVSFSGSKARIALSPAVYRRVKKILEEEQFDVVHVHEPTVPMISVAVLRHSHAINVGTFHAYRESNAIYEYMRPIVKSIVDKLDGRICVSEVVREYITQYFPGKYAIIPNGIDCSRFASADIQPIEQYNDGRPNVLFVGRLEKRKGFRHLIRSFRYIKESIPNARLLVVGAFNDKDKAPFIRYARAAKLRSVHFVGYVPPEELPRYYRTATVFCAPSTGFESFGIILLEAMAAGLPIVASDIPGYNTVVQKGVDGLLVPPSDEPSLANAVIELLRNPEQRAQMIQAGKRKAAQHDWDIIAQNLLTFYEALLAERRTLEQTQPIVKKKRMARVRKMFTWQRTRKPRKAAT